MKCKEGLGELPLRFQLQPARRVASKCSNGVAPVDLAKAHSRGLAICPVPRARCRKLTCDASHPAEEFHETPMRTVYPTAGADAAGLREILSRGNWKLHEASDCHQALTLLRDESVPVLPCERDHADGNWEDLLNIMTSLPAPPNLIVFSRLAGKSFSAKMLKLGGFDVLMTPFEPEEVRIAFAARSRWECGYFASSARSAEAADRRRMSGLSD